MRFIDLARASKMAFSIWVVVLSLAGASQAQITEGKLTLIPQMAHAIEEVVPEFKPYQLADYLPPILDQYDLNEHQAPFAVWADFNGDGVDDLIVHGKTGRETLELAVLSTGQGYRCEVLECAPISEETGYEVSGKRYFGRTLFLEYQSPGPIESRYEKSTLLLKEPAVQLTVFLKASWILFYRQGAWETYTTGD